MIKKKLKNIKAGEFFKRKETSKTVYIRGAYIREDGLNKYECEDWCDINRFIYLKGDTEVFVNFDF